MTPDRLQAIKARLEAATQGQWLCSGPQGGVSIGYPDAAYWAWHVYEQNTGDICYASPIAPYGDAQLIANAPSDLRDLITALEVAQERIATLEAQRDALFTIADAVLPSDFVENKKLGEAWRHAHSIGALK